MLFDPIYNALKKKIKKLYGKEKKLEMEQYLIEKFDLYADLYASEPHKRQEKFSPHSLDTKLRYGFFSVFLILSLVFIFLGMFAYFSLSPISGITLIIIGVILILNSLCLVSGVNRDIFSCCDWC